jgi:hypothetical protein
MELHEMVDAPFANPELKYASRLLAIEVAKRTDNYFLTIIDHNPERTVRGIIKLWEPEFKRIGLI